MAKNPDVPFHEVIDIIRPMADRSYLDKISEYCTLSSSKAADTGLVGGATQLNSLPGCNGLALPKTIIYLDRNNTPDIWGDIKRTVQESSHTEPGQPKDYRTVVLLPKQEDWDKSLYRTKNPICPHLIFECCKRIFNRKEHGCLSGHNKPKAVEVVLKFAKLHDQFDFQD